MKYKITWHEKIRVVMRDPWWRKLLRKFITMEDRTELSEWMFRESEIKLSDPVSVSMSTPRAVVYIDDVSVAETPFNPN